MNETRSDKKPEARGVTIHLPDGSDIALCDWATTSLRSAFVVSLII